MRPNTALLPPRKGSPNILQNQRDPYDHGSYGLLWKLYVPPSAMIPM